MRLNSNRSNGPVHIGLLIAEFIQSLIGREQHSMSRKYIEDIVDLLGQGRSFEQHHPIVKMTIGDLFYEFDVCDDCGKLYNDVVECKLLVENKPVEYFGALEANVKQIRQFNAEREASYSARHNQSTQSRQQ